MCRMPVWSCCARMPQPPLGVPGSNHCHPFWIQWVWHNDAHLFLHVYGIEVFHNTSSLKELPSLSIAWLRMLLGLGDGWGWGWFGPWERGSESSDLSGSSFRTPSLPPPFFLLPLTTQLWNSISSFFFAFTPEVMHSKPCLSLLFTPIFLKFPCLLVLSSSCCCNN